MVYKGHGKDEREKTGKFRSRPAESTYTMTTNRSARFCDNMTERELEVRILLLFEVVRDYKGNGQQWMANVVLFRLMKRVSITT